MESGIFDDLRLELRAFFERMDARREEIDAAVEAAAREIPQFAAILDHTPRDVLDEQAAKSRRLQREALVDGDWTAYLADLRQQGEIYAHQDIPFSTWFRLLGAFRSTITDELLPADDSGARAILDGMDTFLDIAMATIGETYVATKEQLIAETREELAHYMRVAHHAPIGMVIWHWDDPPEPSSFRLIAANPAAQRLAPATLVDTVGLRLSAMPNLARSLEIATQMAQALSDQKSTNWASERTDEQGKRLCLRGHCFPLRGNYVAVIFEDVTDRVQMQEKVERHARELERSNRELDDFAYVASHDLRAPLQDIRNLAQWTREDAGDALPAESGRHLARLEARVIRMERLLDDLLEYSRTGRDHADSTSFALADLVEEIAALLGPSEGFVLSTVRSPRVAVPRAPLAKVLRNLIGNAIKHHDRPQGTVSVDGEVAGGRLVVTVTDDGPGIPAEYQERVFRMFQTLRPRDEVEGSGIGLAIVKKAVEAVGGRVELTSHGRGTTVRFEWPLADPASQLEAS